EMSGDLSQILPPQALAQLAREWLREDVPNFDLAVADTHVVCGFSTKIEVECRNEAEAKEAAKAGADVIMLDNFKPEELYRVAQFLKLEFPSVLIEASGGVTTETLTQYFSANVDIISLGCLTQGCPIADFSLKEKKLQIYMALCEKVIAPLVKK
uniref:Quinolinate phosphoribosyl transferase C-terminal domain-containing protein n=1 Tax=Denticeps clupeoides TaxID=299321 RepID=A0AAY4DC96_9TELE